MRVVIDHQEVFVALKEYLDRRGFRLIDNIVMLYAKTVGDAQFFHAEAKIEVPEPHKEGPYR